MKRATLFSCLLMLSGFMSAAQAESASENRQDVVNERQEHQENRIEQGISSDRLTDNEAKRLENVQDKVEHMEGKAMKDGKMSAREFHHIEHAQNKASRGIARKKHNLRRD